MFFFLCCVWITKTFFFNLEKRKKNERVYVGMIVYVGACCEIFVYDASRLELRMKYMGLSSF